MVREIENEDLEDMAEEAQGQEDIRVREWSAGDMKKRTDSSQKKRRVSSEGRQKRKPITSREQPARSSLGFHDLLTQIEKDSSGL